MTLLEKLGAWTKKPGSEDRLIDAARQGDSAAFDRLAQSYERGLHGYLQRRVGPDAADDVLQEVWIAAWGALSRYAGRASFKAWLFGIAAHKCMDFRRGKMGPTALAGYFEEMITEVPDPRPDPYAASDLKDAVQAALAQLPDSQREVLDLYYYAELTLPEISTALDRNLNTVKYQLYRGHALVASALERGDEMKPTPDRPPGLVKGSCNV